MSIHSDFAGSTLLHKGGGWEPQRKSNFAVIIYGVGGTNLALQVRDTDLPQREHVRKGIKYFNQTSHYAGSIAPPADWNINYVDYIDRQGWETLSGWMKEVAENGAIKRAADYKRCGEVIHLTPEGDTVRKYVLEGCFPTVLKGEGFDNENDGDPQLIQLTISVDEVKPPGF